MALRSIFLLGLTASPSTAFFLMPCWPITTQRLDPIVNPGKISSHVHQIIGGNAFAPAMDYNSTQAPDVCTTCFVKGDHSNYWIPRMYFQHSDGTFEGVNQVGSTSVYYFNEASRMGPGETVESFPVGLRMLAGDPAKRTGSNSPEDQAINYKCLNYAGAPTDSKGFPNVDCPDGVRAEVTYPSCWDGKNLDSADHKSHMAYPTGNFESGSCPSTHPHHTVTLKVEFIFDTHSFAGKWSGGKQPFVWSTGDPTGFGLHADYVMGWEAGLLESATAQCHDIYGVLGNCAPFNGRLPPTDQTFANPGTCTVQDYVNEKVGGTVSKLPGCNPVNANDNGSSACDAGASLSGSWGSGVASVISSLVGGILPTGASKPSSVPSAGAPAGPGTGTATPAAIYSSASYGGGGYPGSSSAVTYGAVAAASSGAAFYQASVTSSSSSSPAAAAPVAAVATSAATSPAPAPPAPPAAPTSWVEGSVGADGRRTRTVWDILTVTEYVTGYPPSQTQWKREIEHVHKHRHAHGRRHHDMV